MKKTTLLLVIISLLGLKSIAQTVTTEYYDRYLYSLKPEKRSYYKKTTKIVNGDKYEEIIKRKDNSLYASYKNGEPFGIWKVDDRVFDFNFEMNYIDTSCTTTNPNFKHWLNDDESISYIAPKTIDGEGALQAIGKNVFYPRSAEKKGLEGRVVSRFTISSTGKIENICILESAGFEFDKEVCRLLRLMDVTAPSVNNKPISICVTLPINFSLPE